MKLGTLIKYGATYHGSNSQAGETNSDHSVQRTRIMKNNSRLIYGKLDAVILKANFVWFRVHRWLVEDQLWLIMA